LLIDQGKPRPDELCPLDAPYDYFRIRLICTLLDTCGTCLKEDSRLNIFLVLFQVYIKTKFPPPTDILFLIQEIFEVSYIIIIIIIIYICVCLFIIK